MNRATFALAVSVLLLLVLAASAAQAQILEAELKVKGLACPFCAYGLERKLKKLPGAQTVEVVMDEDVARVQFDGEVSPPIEDIPKVVHDAGFELAEMRLRVLAKHARFEGLPSLELSAGQLLVFKTEGRGGALAEEVAEGALVEATGIVRQTQRSGHHGHPYTMEIENFQVRERETRKDD